MFDPSDYLIIDDDNYTDFLGPEAKVGTRTFKKGLVPRDYTMNPQGSYKSAPPYDPDTMPLIPREDWSERIADMEATKSRISDIRMTAAPGGSHIPALDQNGQGYCWAYSSTMCLMMSRMMSNMPYVRLSAHSVACVIKNFRDQGGWGCASLDFIQDRGVASIDDWPEKSMSRSHDNETTWNNAKEFRCIESWMDIGPAAYDRDLTFDQVMTCLLNRVPVVGDFNWWGHSVALVDPVELDKRMSLSNPNRWGTATINSWTDNWGTLGYGILRGSKGVPDGGAALRAAWGG